MALAPDLDYAVPALQASHHHGLRITHSILVSLLLPLTTGVWLMFRKNKDVQRLSLRSHPLEAVFAGLSHLVMDLLVGVTPLPLLWPLSSHPLKLPFGILPSAGRLQLGNSLLYQNLGIELGVLVPASIVFLLTVRGKGHPLVIAGLSLMSLYFMVWAAQLAR